MSLSASYLGTAPVLKWWVLLSQTLTLPLPSPHSLTPIPTSSVLLGPDCPLCLSALLFLAGLQETSPLITPPQGPVTLPIMLLCPFSLPLPERDKEPATCSGSVLGILLRDQTLPSCPYHQHWTPNSCHLPTSQLSSHPPQDFSPSPPYSPAPSDTAAPSPPSSLLRDDLFCFREEPRPSSDGKALLLPCSHPPVTHGRAYPSLLLSPALWF